MNSFIAYMGGKSLLAKTIIPKMPEHKCYVEVFAGAAWMLFKKNERDSEVEIINDINSDLITLYRCIKHHVDEFIRYFRWALISRDEFYRLRKEDPETLTDIQRAARFYYLLKAGFAAKVHDPYFAVATTSKPRLNLLRIEEELSAIHLRLARVYVENRPYHEVFAKFDKPDTFFYVDPPYHGCEDYYGPGIFEESDFVKLRGLLQGLSGKFIMSINDDEYIRELFKDFVFDLVKTSYSAAGGHKKKRVNELLVMNY